jgi:hypothetical protein
MVLSRSIGGADAGWVEQSEIHHTNSPRRRERISASRRRKGERGIWHVGWTKRVGRNPFIAPLTHSQSGFFGRDRKSWPLVGNVQQVMKQRAA